MRMNQEAANHLAENMAPSGVEKGPGSRGWLRGTYDFITDRNDFRRNLIVNVGLFAAAVWIARNMTDMDLTAPPPAL